ncbi:MAG TPA: thiamine-binding protein [Chitinophagaceae bacterium]|nr:thiamine-binding protein [Chitinophagaceae bacterium]
MEPLVNIALQILPSAPGKNSYDLVDRAIEVIRDSGVPYRVCPFETVMEGRYEDLMEIAEKAQEACFSQGAEEMLVFIKIQRRKGRDVTIGDKMEKYGG